MVLRSLLLVVFLLSLVLFVSVFASAQTVSGPLREVRIEGASVNEDLIRTLLVSRPGSRAEAVDLEAERNLVYSLGYYDRVSVSLEDRGAGPILIVRVEENPLIERVAFEDVSLTNPANFVAIVAQRHLLEPGRVLNTVEAEASLATVQAVYRQNGFPFDVDVNLAILPASSAAEEDTAGEEAEADTTEPETGDAETGDPDEAEGQTPPAGSGVSPLPAGLEEPVVLRYTVSETAPLREVVFEGNTVLTDEELSEVFAPLEALGSFDVLAYQEAVAEVNARYRELGYRDSGVDPSATELEDGTLALGLRELRVAGIDTSALGIDPLELSLQPGDLYNYDVLLEDVKRLSVGRTSDISLADPLILSNGQVRLSFLAGAPETAGPIEEVVLEGNTVIETSELLPLLSLGEGDTFTSALATEDFARLAQYYAEQGYVLGATPSFSYLDGRYVQRLSELKVAGYEIAFESERPKTRPDVITRYLPDPGGVLNQNALRESLIRVARLGIVEPYASSLEPTEVPGEVIVVVNVRERPTGTFGPEATYDTQRGFSANLSYGDSNFLGLAHDFRVSASAQTSDVGFLLGGSLDYSVPWLYIDAFDFKEVPTSLSGSLFSTVETNQALALDGQLRVCADPDDRAAGNDCPDAERVFVGEYAKRESGLGFSVGRQIFPDTTLRASVRGSYAAYFLEPERPCVFDDAGLPTNAEDCTLPEAVTRPVLPQSGLSATLSGTVSFDNRDNLDFPRSGVAATGSVGLGFGNDYRSPSTGEQASYTYLPLEFGVRTYLPLAELAPNAIRDRNHVLAFKANLGHQFGGDYPVNRYFRVGQTLNDATLLRGFTRADFNPSRSYLTGSVEYRYDFGLSTIATQTVVGIVWVDAGWVSSVPGFGDYGAPLFMSAGVGLQVNLGFTALGFFPLRFDYGFSERHPGGVFGFRLGSVF